MASKESFRAGTVISFTPKGRDKATYMDVCHVYYSGAGDEYLAQSLTNGRCGYGATADDAYVDLIYKVAREFMWSAAAGLDYAKETGFLRASDEQRAAARKQSRIDPQRHRRLMDRARKEITGNPVLWDEHGAVVFDRSRLEDTGVDGIHLNRPRPRQEDEVLV